MEAHPQPVWGRRRAVDQLNSISGTSLFFILCALSISLLLCKNDNTSSGTLIDTAFPVTDFGLHYRVMDLAVAKYWQCNEVLEVTHQGCCWAWDSVGGSKQQGREALCHLGPRCSISGIDRSYSLKNWTSCHHTAGHLQHQGLGTKVSGTSFSPSSWGSLGHAGCTCDRTAVETTAAPSGPSSLPDRWSVGFMLIVICCSVAVCTPRALPSVLTPSP